jgi:hypothetical protein
MPSILELNPFREIGRPCGVGKDHVEFKLLCGWRLMSGCSLITVGVNGVLELLPYALDVTKMLKPLFMC